MIVTSITEALVLIVFGAIIWKFKMTGLIAGSQTGRQVDREGLARWIGKNMIFIGIVVGIAAFIQVLIFEDTYIAVDAFIILALATRMAVGVNRFSKPMPKPSKKSLAKKKYK